MTPATPPSRSRAPATLADVDLVRPLSLPGLSDGVVELRAFAVEDAPALMAIWGDPTIRARNQVPEPSEPAAREWMARAAARAAAGDAWEWAIVDADSGALAGRRALKEIDWAQKRAVAGTWVAEWFRGRRFAARSLRLAAAHAFANGIVRIHGECETDNEASLRSMLAAGMRHEGTRRSYCVSDSGTPIDLHVLGMLDQDLRGAPPFPEVHRFRGSSGPSAADRKRRHAECGLPVSRRGRPVALPVGPRVPGGAGHRCGRELREMKSG